MRCLRSTSGSAASWNCDSLPGSTSLRRPTRSVYRRPRSSANGPWRRPGFTSGCRHRKSPRSVRIPGTVTLPREAWPRLKEAFEGARALAVDARLAYLAEVCKGDEALRHEVELLL